MIIDVINKILLMVFVLATLNVLRHIFFTIQIWFLNDTEGERYSLTNKAIILLGISIAYIVSCLFTGIYL